MVNEDACGFLKRLFRVNGTIGGNLKDELLVVGLLLYAEVLYGVLDIPDGCVN